MVGNGPTRFTLPTKQASIYHFNKPFEELSCYQLAELVVNVGANKVHPL